MSRIKSSPTPAATAGVRLRCSAPLYSVQNLDTGKETWKENGRGEEERERERDEEGLGE